MWCPSASLSIWTNSWLAGVAAPDDVLDALSQWTPRHSVTAYDALAAERTGLPWPDLDDAGAVSLLQTMRTAAGPAGSRPTIALALPIPGDVRGLPAGTQFGRDAIAAGEAMVLEGFNGAIGLVPDFEYPESPDDDFEFEFDPELCALSWTVYSIDAAPPPAHLDLGEAEYALRDAVRSAADALTALRAGASGGDVGDPRRLVEQVLDSTRAHRIPDHAPTRAIRVLENAAHVDAIITVSAELIPIGQSSSEVQLASDALRPLNSVVRSARLAAIDAIFHSAWRS
jgi:hypothetical protein